VPRTSQKLASRPPAAVRQAVERLGANIALARKNRRWRQLDLAAKSGLTRRVIINIEAGHPGVGVGAYVAALWALGLDRDLSMLAAPERDSEGQTLAAARGGKRVRLRAGLDDDF
jgi:transcriptional regulator with XRE-family HTH domain